MKFFHTADWHLGKTVNGFSMLADQQYFLEGLLSLITTERPDALLIAGDIYDRPVP
ncbi:MAG: metallophosphoesterase, partial [Oscillospiraceae bacterium]